MATQPAAKPPDGTVEQRMLVHLTVDGVDLGVWDTWSGAEKDTDSTKYRSGGNPDQESLGGGNTFSDLTITRNYRLSRDRSIEAFLYKSAGTGAAKASKTMLDRKYVAYGNPITVNGVLKTYAGPNADSNANNPAMLSVTIEVNSIIA
jgi:hypothetical protein